MKPIFENNELLILNKPAGVPTTVLRPIDIPTSDVFLGQALSHFPVLQSIGPEREYGLLHRLDNATSGALAFAKTKEAHEHWRKNWNEVKKFYRAICQNQPNELKTLPREITFPLGQLKSSAKKVFVAKKELGTFQKRQIRGRLTETKTVILAATEINPQLVDLEIELVTGFRHQIRAHLTAVHLPVLGDERYGGKPSDRLWLHAWKLKIGEIEAEADLPFDWPVFEPH